VTGTPQPCYRSISIVADGRLEVCDGAHCAFVMKKIEIGLWEVSENRLAVGGTWNPTLQKTKGGAPAS